MFFSLNLISDFNLRTFLQNYVVLEENFFSKSHRVLWRWGKPRAVQSTTGGEFHWLPRIRGIRVSHSGRVPWGGSGRWWRRRWRRWSRRNRPKSYEKGQKLSRSEALLCRCVTCNYFEEGVTVFNIWRKFSQDDTGARFLQNRAIILNTWPSYLHLFFSLYTDRDNTGPSDKFVKQDELLSTQYQD